MAFDGTRAQFYRHRAREVRETAETCRYPEIREQLRAIAEQYDALARIAEEPRRPG
ncbi:MAG TPA: hypothetical protein VN766_17940 [Stellaceae bacterium]|jgi:hypothetical protein|nr:hypothetical protein [Stellaceae bacterium]